MVCILQHFGFEHTNFAMDKHMKSLAEGMFFYLATLAINVFHVRDDAKMIIVASTCKNPTWINIIGEFCFYNKKGEIYHCCVFFKCVGR